jgi:alpha-tubulin suppressor-like RCC1 family protein
VPSTLTNVTAISCGPYHSGAVTREGKVVCWGSNDDRECDVPDTLENVIAIGCGLNRNYALTQDEH